MRWPRWLRQRSFDACPVCGGDARDHEVRTLARERFAPGLSGVEASLAANDFAAAARLDDRAVMGDLLVHQVIRCGSSAGLVTLEDSLTHGPARVRRAMVLDGLLAAQAWDAAR